jgi:methyl-accepting chemotaxis protein
MLFKGKKNVQEAEFTARIETLESEISSIHANIAVIEFAPEGTIISANPLFLGVTGYSLDEIKGKHHQIFCKKDYTSSSEYRDFWTSLGKGISCQGIFERINKAGQTIWLQATYFPVLNDQNQVVKIIKMASDISQKQKEVIEKEALLEALDKSMAVIEFQPDGIILHANGNFLKATGYLLEEIKGQHHEMFCYPNFYQENPDFWRRLADGEFFTGRFERRNATGEQLWLEASYNPVFDTNGQVYKVIKFASDITATVKAAREAAEAAASTSEETTQITSNTMQILKEAVQISADISEQVQVAGKISEQLSKQASSIKDIVTTINSIADQTNLLALNAAIEAARAGESGRGFAVVADEVRMLAGRTSESTQQIESVVNENADLIEKIHSKMEQINQTSRQGAEKVSGVTSGIADVEQGVASLAQTIHRLH